MSSPPLDWHQIDPILENALREDVGSGDVTSETLFAAAKPGHAYLLAKEAGTIAGLPLAERVFRKLDPGCRWQPAVAEGAAVESGRLIAEVQGSARALLTGERLALNILQRLSGIATLTGRFVEKLAGLPIILLDTRKTLPGLRVLEKYAVAVGGGRNHRYGLYDGVMIKDNHIKLAGGIPAALAQIGPARERNLQIEVETTTLAEVNEALLGGADIIMLDNMTPAMMREAVTLIAGRAKTEASGGITLDTVRAIAETGVDFISVGALTHSPRALDIGLYFY